MGSVDEVVVKSDEGSVSFVVKTVGALLAERELRFQQLLEKVVEAMLCVHS